MNGSENNTQQTSVGFAPPLLIAVVALLGIFGLQLPLGQRQGVKSPTAETPTSKPTEEKDPDGRQFPPLVLLKEYLNYRPEKSSAKPNVKSDFAQSIKLSIPPLATNPLLTVESKTSVASPSLSNTQTKTWLDELSAVLKKSPQMKCLIATVPDPIDSHFQLMFDNRISAICRGFESHGFVLDRHMLLWQDEIRRTTKEDPQSTARRRPYQLTPSAILFRGKGEIVMLLLVGETPTAGIHKEALGSALNFVAAYEKGTTNECAIQIRLLGPEFSGSSTSLQIAILDWWEKFEKKTSSVKVEIISGSATSFTNRETLTFSVRPQGGKPSDAPGLEVEFIATVVPDDVALQGILEHLTDTRRIPWYKILALGEATSDYGRQMQKIKHQEKKNQEKKNPKIGEKTLRILPFPMALSRLRSEYDKTETGRSEASAKREPTPRKNFDLTLEQSKSAIDVLPIFSDLTAAVTDLTLEQVLATIAREDIRAVGLLATDVRDKLFLAEQIRLHAPDVQLFTLESDVLYTHAQFSGTTSGMLVATTYPLFTRSRNWAGHPNDLPFSTDTEQGIYNATVAHLNGLYAKESRADVPLLDYAAPFGENPDVRNPTIPRLWLSMVGETAMWPVSVVEPAMWSDFRVEPANRYRDYLYPPQNTTQKLAEPKFVVFPPKKLPLYLFGSISLVLAVSFLLANSSGSMRHWLVTTSAAVFPANQWSVDCVSWVARFFPWLVLGGAESSGETSIKSRGAYAYVLFMGLLALQITVACPSAVFLCLLLRYPNITLYDQSYQHWFGNLVAYVAWGLSFVLTLVSISKLFGQLSSWLRWLSALVGIAVVITGLYWVDHFSGINAAIFVERVGTYSSGVTPLFPLVALFIAICLWAICHLFRCHYVQIYRLANPLPCGESPHLAGIEERFTDLNDRIELPVIQFGSGSDWVFACAVTWSTLYVFFFRWVGTAEGAFFDWIYAVISVITLAFFGGLLIRLKSVLGMFERLLRRLGQHAMVSAYNRVPERLASKAAGQIFSDAPHQGDLEQYVRCLRQLAELKDKSASEEVVVTELANGAVLIEETSLPDARCIWPDGRFLADHVDKDLMALLSLPRCESLHAEILASHLNRQFAMISRRHLAPKLLNYWNKIPLRPEGASETKESVRPTNGDPGQQWNEQAETFVAMQMVNLIRQVFAHIHNMATFAIAMLLCLLISFQGYPFQPHGLLLSLWMGLMVWTLVIVMIATVRFNKNEVLSRISKTTPNQITWDRSLIVPLLAYGAMPIIGILAVQFPPLGRIMFSWVSVLTRTFGG